MQSALSAACSHYKSRGLNKNKSAPFVHRALISGSLIWLDVTCILFATLQDDPLLLASPNNRAESRIQ